MVATKVLISLCVVGLARAAPQLGVPLPLTTAATSSSLNERVIVNDVVTSLQPSIAAAVANALRSLSFSSTTSSSSNSNNFGASRNTASNFGSSSATGFASGASVSSNSQQEEVTVRPNYNYEFKVADDDKQTYISHNEARDGDDVTGTYSYVDPNGALITVNYQAGVMGYTQTLDKQEGAVSIRSNNAASSSTGASSSSANVGSSFGSSSSSSSFGSSSGSSSRNSGSSFTSSSSSALNESDLITRIITALQPQISSAVNSAISTQNSAAQQTSFRTVSSNTGFAAGDRLTPLFGN